jgi:hypothetical protein
MSSIVEDWISRANAKQRRGRAGRVKPGLCFCLYTRHRFENIMRPFQVIGCPCYFSLWLSPRLRAILYLFLCLGPWVIMLSLPHLLFHSVNAFWITMHGNLLRSEETILVSYTIWELQMSSTHMTYSLHF